MYNKWNKVIERFLAGYRSSVDSSSKRKNVPLISQELREIFDKLWTEFDDSKFSTSDAVRNRSENRYSNILPYNYNRVRLNWPPVIVANGCKKDKNKKSDYINASLVESRLTQRSYIMCQGPLESTASAFWTMVVQKKVPMIVMLGNFVEQDRKKIWEYFPLHSTEQENKESQNKKIETYKIFDNLKITCNSVSDVENILIRRKMEILDLNSGETWACVHCHFSAWSDFGVPSKVEYMETLLNLINDENKVSDNPVVVHCSAGVGRSGVVVYCDIVLSRLSESSLESVGFVEELLALRKQRMKSIQTFQQFLYALQVLKKMYPKVANWGTLSPIKKSALSDNTLDNDSLNNENHFARKRSSTQNSDFVRVKRKVQCISDDSFDSYEDNFEKRRKNESEAPKPPPCPVRTTSLVVNNSDEDSIEVIDDHNVTDQENPTTSAPVPRRISLFSTPKISKENANRSFLGLNKTDSKLFLKSKLGSGKKKLTSSLRKNLVSKFRKVDVTQVLTTNDS